MYSVLSEWTYDRDPTKNIDFTDTWYRFVDEVREKGSDLFVDFVQQYLVDNKHYAVVQLFPKRGMVQQASQVGVDTSVHFSLACV